MNAAKTSLFLILVAMSGQGCGATRAGEISCDSTTPQLVATPKPLAFGTVNVGAAVAMDLSLTNVGECPVTIAAVMVADFDDITVPLQELMTTDCHGNQRSGSLDQLMAGECANIVVQFAPTTVESISNELKVLASGSTSPAASIAVTAASR